MVGLLVVLLTGCAASRTTSIRSEKTATNNHAGADHLAVRLRRAITPWLGTPYQWGGSSRSGIDCSAFVAAIYDEVFGYTLPRTTRQQVRVGRAVPPDELAPGDLVFFKPPESKRHVGIYLNDRSFAHVSTSSGVTVSSLDLPYWQRAYWTARRIIQPAVGRRSTSETGGKTVTHPPQSTGW